MIDVGFDSRWIGCNGIGRFSKEISNRINFCDCFYSKGNNAVGPLSSFYIDAWIKKNQIKSFFSPGYIPPFKSKIPFIFTIHDLNHLDVEYNTSITKKIFYNTIIKKGILNSSAIYTVSEFSKNRIVEWSGCNPGKIKVVYNGISDIFYSNKNKIVKEKPYIFCCSNRKGHKNEYRLIQAFSLSKLNDDFNLIFSGYPTNELQLLINKFKINNDVKFTGRLDEVELSSWYKGATFTIFPSLYEGFGLPLVESMASGTPVIASNTSSLPEIGGDAAYYIDPYDIDSISIGMRELASSCILRDSLTNKGFERAKSFSWERTANLVSIGLNSIIS